MIPILAEMVAPVSKRTTSSMNAGVPLATQATIVKLVGSFWYKFQSFPHVCEQPHPMSNIKLKNLPPQAILTT